MRSADRGGTENDRTGNGVASRGMGRGGARPGCRRARLGGRGGAGHLDVRGDAASRCETYRHGLRCTALLDRRRDGRAGRRGPLDGRAGVAAVPVPESDKRFADRAWSDNPAFFAIRQTHLAAARLASELLEAGAGNTMDDAKAALATGFLMDALAPTNFLLTNPAALKRAFETAGASLVDRASHFVDDMLNNGGRPRQVAPGRSGSAITSPRPPARSCSRTT